MIEAHISVGFIVDVVVRWITWLCYDSTLAESPRSAPLFSAPELNFIPGTHTWLQLDIFTLPGSVLTALPQSVDTEDVHKRAGLFKSGVTLIQKDAAIAN